MHTLETASIVESPEKLLPTLTIAIPTFNRCQTLVALIQSLLPQLQPEDELLVVDDGSTDGTAEQLKQIPQVRLLVNPVNYGMVKTWNTCLSSASSNWICMIHDDDQVMPDSLQTIRHLCAVVDQPALIAHWAVDPEIDQNLRYRVVEPGAWSVLNATTIPSGVTVHRAIVEDMGGFDETLFYSTDIEYFARICMCYPCYVIESPRILYYNEHDQNYRYKTWRKPDFMQQLETIEQKIMAYAKLNPSDRDRRFRERMNNYASHMLKGAALAKDATLIRDVGLLLWKQPYLRHKLRLSALIAALFKLSIRF